MELDTLAVGDVLCGSALFGGTNWWDSGGSSVPGENGRLVDELSTLWSFLPAASDNSSPSPTTGGTEEASSVQAIRTTSKNSKIQWASSKDGWVCEYPECNRSFSQRHKLNRHQKYHTKPHRCLESGCIGRRIAFSLEKDLIRHQSQHNGCRFFCSYVDCSHSIDGLNGGFTRKDNLKRHLTNQHRCL
ncbi:uncharacterized protein PAC_02504 [Phialocephala subalpina]|uniref:C2H2-type domain-containing protein n=1 Tax=Phialocephala subalpina TaxID=576137 RepID=A0A1L7WIN2_9HELO|nr:uncharacterized protein PAC_02504 [Phialocephala subalpina]